MPEQTTDATRGRRPWGTRTRLALAGIAVLGVGAAITTAAWTDQVWFEAGATAAGSIELKGCILGDGEVVGDCQGADWMDSPDEGSIDLVYSGFDPFEPDTPQAFEIAVQNNGTAVAALTWTTSVVTTAGDAACGAGWTITLTTAPATLGVGATSAAIEVEVATPSPWVDGGGLDCHGWEGAIRIQVVGVVA